MEQTIRNGLALYYKLDSRHCKEGLISFPPLQTTMQIVKVLFGAVSVSIMDESVRIDHIDRVSLF